ncbi:MAG: type IV pilin protein [Gammaproteobacteria bacterium]
MRNRNLQGFTLIELMIAVAIVGILAAIAYPSYQNSVTKSRRAEGKSLLLDAAAREERYFAQYNNYTADVIPSASPCAPVLAGTVITGNTCGLNYTSASSANGYYTLTAVATPTTYTLTATALGTQLANDKNCKTFSLDNLGVKSSTNSGDAASTECW